MKSSDQKITVANVLLAGGILAGIVIRFTRLGSHPLDNAEAELAWQAYQTAQGVQVNWSGDPLYLLVTTALFSLFRDSNFLARLFPALMGSALLFAPLFFKDKIRPASLIIIVWLLAFDPALVASSRTAGSWVLPVTCLAFFLGALHQRRMTLAAVLLGAVWLSGPSLWALLPVFVVALLLWRWNQPGRSALLCQEFPAVPFTFWIMTFGSFFLLSTACMLMPQGLSALGGSFVDFLSYWRSGSPDSMQLVLWTLPFYNPLILIGGVLGILRSIKTKDGQGILLSILAAVAFLLILGMPGRQPWMMMWVTIPLMGLTAGQIEDCISVPNPDAKQSALIAGFVTMILLFLWEVFGSVNQGALDANNLFLYAGAGIAILVVCAILAIMGWSLQAAATGYAWAFILMLSLFGVSSAWRSAGISTDISKEFWNMGEDPTQVRLLTATVEEISGRVRGVSDGLDILALGTVDPAVEWELRHQTVDQVEGVMPGDTPAMVITAADAQLNLPESYRGQDFTILSRMDWSAMTVQDWLKWVMIRDIPTQATETRILWVRGDLFPGYHTTTAISTE